MMDFEDMVCVVDGTEVQVARPVGWERQKVHWSGKKHQHSVNILIVTTLDGRIIYHSSWKCGNQLTDQAAWNNDRLRERFLQKDYGIGGDGGFYFNRKLDNEHIKGFKPRRGRKGNTLTDEDITWNRKFSQMRVIVENAIGRLKKWRVLKGVYRHLKGERSQLDLNNIVTICCALTNRLLSKNPLRPPSWMTPAIKDFMENINICEE